MAKDLTVKNSQLPAHLQVAADATKEFTGGVQSGFPVISIRGRVWRVKIGGEEQPYLDENEDAVPSVELVLVRSHEKPSKIHYDKKWEEGDDSKPRCWSADGVTPSADVENPIHPTCAGCLKNQWGSRITEAGKKSRACSDVRRVAVVFADDLAKVEDDPSHVPTAMLLRVPPASLNPLKDYVGTQLAPKGIQPYMIVSRVGFDNESEYPKLTFKAARFVSEAEYGAITALRESEEVKRILQSATEYSAAGTTGTEAPADGESEEATAKAEATPRAASKPAPAAASKLAPAAPSKPKAAKKRDATAAEAEAAAAQAEVATPDEVEAPKPAKPTKVAKPPVVIEPEAAADEDEEGVTTAEEPAGDDFDAMLQSILGPQK